MQTEVAFAFHIFFLMTSSFLSGADVNHRNQTPIKFIAAVKLTLVELTLTPLAI
ncbi:hypothetical protein THOE12_70065 [Vibrio rotiferianus]|nr:hypothetical protein THOE12_70065 [Vibrio rotiferianus]